MSCSKCFVVNRGERFALGIHKSARLKYLRLGEFREVLDFFVAAGSACDRMRARIIEHHHSHLRRDNRVHRIEVCATLVKAGGSNTR